MRRTPPPGPNQIGVPAVRQDREGGKSAGGRRNHSGKRRGTLILRRKSYDPLGPSQEEKGRAVWNAQMNARAKEREGSRRTTQQPGEVRSEEFGRTARRIGEGKLGEIRLREGLIPLRKKREGLDRLERRLPSLFIVKNAKQNIGHAKKANDAKKRIWSACSFLKERNFSERVWSPKF